MRLTATLFSIVFLLYACAKETAAPSKLSGIWVEQSLRFDTLDFDNKVFLSTNSDTIGTVQFRCKPFTDVAINPNFPINNSTFYNYYLKADSLFLRNFLSSYSGFYRYSFTMNSEQSFSVARFYNRNMLPATITFKRIQ